MKTWAIFGLVFTVALIFAGCAQEETGTVTGAGKSGTQIAETELTGVLSAADSPYWITHDLVVPAGESLTIEPGVELRFDGLYKFVVNGHLDAVGTAENNIVFTSMDGALGDGDYGQWRAIVFDTGDDVSEMAFCTVEFAAVWDSSERYPVYPDTVDSLGRWLNGAIFVWECSPIIRNSTIILNGYHGIYCLGENANPLILNNSLYDNDGDGVRVESGAEAQIRYNNSKENNARQYPSEGELPDFPGVGHNVQLNANRDSCDAYFNTKLDPAYEDYLNQDYTLLSTSSLIGAGLDTLGSGTVIGSIPYYVGETELRGPIGGTVMTAALSPWYVTNDIFTEPGETLTSEPGVTIIFNASYSVRLAGSFEIEGTTFIPADSTNPSVHWEGIEITADAEEGSYIRNCRFVNASTTMKTEPYGGAITVTGASPEISGNTFTNSEYAAISCRSGAMPEISSNLIEGFGPMGILCYNNAHPHIHHNIIHGGYGYGIMCDFLSSPWIETNIIYTTNLIGIKATSESSPLIEYNTIVGHDYSGVEITASSNPTVQNNIIAFNGSPTTWSTGTLTGAAATTLGSNSITAMTLEFDVYRRMPSTEEQVSRVGINDGGWSAETGFYLEIANCATVAANWNGTVLEDAAVPDFEDRWQHVKMERDAAGYWTVTWDEGGANETVVSGQDQFGTIDNPYIWIEGYPESNSADYDNFTLTVNDSVVWSDDFEDGDFYNDPAWLMQAGNGEIVEISNSYCFHVFGSEIYGNGINLEGSSYPVVTYNDVFQPDGEGHPFGGISPDNTNITLDPKFIDKDNADFHLQSDSPCLTAGSDGGEIGAYGKDSNW